MDLNEFWQENKRWILAVALGFVVFLVVQSVIGSVYSTSGKALEARRLLGGSNEKLYDSQVLAEAKEDAAELNAELERLRKALEFHPDPRFSLEGKGMAPDAFLTQQGREVVKQLTASADALDVALSDQDIVYPRPVVVEEIRQTLLGLDVVHQAVSRLLAAHERVRGNDPEAAGVRAIEKFQVPPVRSSTRRGILPLGRGRRDEVDLGDLLTENRVDFEFRADAETTQVWLEMLKDPANPLALEEIRITQGNRPGDPLGVKGRLLALVFLYVGTRDGEAGKEGPQ